MSLGTYRFYLPMGTKVRLVEVAIIQVIRYLQVLANCGYKSQAGISSRVIMYQQILVTFGYKSRDGRSSIHPSQGVPIGFRYLVQKIGMVGVAFIRVIGYLKVLDTQGYGATLFLPLFNYFQFLKQHNFKTFILFNQATLSTYYNKDRGGTPTQVFQPRYVGKTFSAKCT